MVDNIKPTKLGNTPYVKGKSATHSPSGAPTKSNTQPASGMLSEHLDKIIKNLHEDSSGDIDDTAKINEIKTQLRQGTYEVDSAKLAKNILQEYAPELVESDK